MQDIINMDYITEQEARELKGLFTKYRRSYAEKDEVVSDQEWLERVFDTELPKTQCEEAKQDAQEIVEAIQEFDRHLHSVSEAAKKGTSKERWLTTQMQEASVGMSVNEYGQRLHALDHALYQKNVVLTNALKRAADGQIKMSRNLDGNIAEHMVAKTAEASGYLQQKNVRVEVRDALTPNSVDVRAINGDTGQYMNYQLKFGKDAKATIDLIERGNYNNQRLIVPSEQLDEIRAHFRTKGSSKTISDHINAWGAKGKKFTKSDMKELQLAAQEDGIMPTLDYSHYQTRDLAMSIGKNASVMALQTAAVTTGLHVAEKMFKGESIDADKMVEMALKTGMDTSVKVVTAGTLQVAVRKGMIRLMPRSTPAGVIANIACVGIENGKVLYKIASGKLSLTKGLDQMGRVTVSMVAGLSGMAQGSAIGASLTAWIPVVGPPLSIATGLIGGMVGYAAGSKVGEAVHKAGIEVASAARSVAQAACSGLKSVERTINTGISNVGRAITELIGL